jgi:hypothetical protein
MNNRYLPDGDLFPSRGFKNRGGIHSGTADDAAPNRFPAPVIHDYKLNIGIGTAQPGYFQNLIVHGAGKTVVAVPIEQDGPFGHLVGAASNVLGALVLRLSRRGVQIDEVRCTGRLQTRIDSSISIEVEAGPGVGSIFIAAQSGTGLEKTG